MLEKASVDFIYVDDIKVTLRDKHSKKEINLQRTFSSVAIKML